MKTLLITLNAKYIHTSLALRWLYVASKDHCDISFKEYTLREKKENIVEDVLSSGCDILGIGVYIWNTNNFEVIVSILKARKPDLIIILGGPEVTYEPRYFLENWLVNYVVSGEAEFILAPLIQKIKKGETIEMDGVSHKEYHSKIVVEADLEQLTTLLSPYQLEEDKESLPHRIMYFETSRGCPYSCEYCLSSLEKGVRYFPLPYLYENLNYLIEGKTKQVKFLDRTFNLHHKRTKSIFEFLKAHYRPNLSFQFEIYADILDKSLIHYINTSIPKGYFRFEIGIQSTYEPTNEAISRKQNFKILTNNTRLLNEGGKIDFHLDLIAGLPFETFDRFKRSFNDVFSLSAKEVQLGFLKLLRGTKLRKKADLYGYVYQPDAPYEVISNHFLTKEEIIQLHRVEHAVQRCWNSGFFKNTLNSLFLNEYRGGYFELFHDIGEYDLEQQFPHSGYQLESLFNHMNSFLLSRGIDKVHPLRTDYYAHFKIRPAAFWIKGLNKEERRFWAYAIGNDKVFLTKHNLTRKLIEKNTRIDPLSGNQLLLTIYLPVNEETQITTILYSKEKEH